jgi:hypothetical protein
MALRTIYRLLREKVELALLSDPNGYSDTTNASEPSFPSHPICHSQTDCARSTSRTPSISTFTRTCRFSAGFAICMLAPGHKWWTS